MRAAVLVLVMLLLACKPVVDAGRSEKAISDWLTDQLGIEVDDVVCPRDVPRAAGKRFTCTATAEGGEITVHVAQTNDDGATRFGTSDIDGIVVSARLEDQIERAFRNRADMEVTVDCGRRHRVAVPGAKLTCTVENRDGDREPIVATVQDRAGNVSWRLDR